MWRRGRTHQTADGCCRNACRYRSYVRGLQHLIIPGRIAASIGWPRGSGFRSEPGKAEVGIGVAGFLTPWFGVPYVIGPALRAPAAGYATR
jgi:hypothetical protein